MDHHRENQGLFQIRLYKHLKMGFLKSVLFTYVLALNNIVPFLFLCPTK